MPVSVERAADFPTSRVRTRAEAEAYVASVCFKHGPPRLVGVELEWTVHHAKNPRAPLDIRVLRDALGAHAPPSLRPDSPHQPLPNGSTVTLEPGGQVEISSLPASDPRSLLDNVAADADHLGARLAEVGLMPGREGTDPWRTPRRLLDLPRYAAMESAFDHIGEDGRRMMCSTAGVQVCLDMGARDRLSARWAALHALGPIMLAVFGNSPRLRGKRTQWRSARARTLLRTDPRRMRPGPITGDPASSWARRVLATSVICRRQPGPDWTVPPGISFADWIDGALPGPPTVDDLDYHLSTMFPPVRPRGYFEVRYLDAQPGARWMLPTAMLIALLSDEDVVDGVLAAISPGVGRWLHAARYGLCDPTLARGAARIAALASARIGALDFPAQLDESVSEHIERELAAARGPQGR